MFDFYLKRKRAAALLLLLAAGTSLAESKAPAAYRMSVIEDAAYGHSIMRGKFDKGISGIEAYAGARAKSFAASNNLCVAYTKTRRFAKAALACDAALAVSEATMVKAERYGRRDRLASTQRALRDVSVAYSNRGVLRAVTGDSAGALEDFEQASKAGTDRYAIANNLTRLRAVQEPALTAFQIDR